MLKQLENSQSYASTFLQPFKVTARFLYSNFSWVRQWMIYIQFPCLYILYSVYKNVSIINVGVWKVYLITFLLLKEGVLSVLRYIENVVRILSTSLKKFQEDNRI